ncbi:MAG: MFS transporter [Proteobacteria bacterium]|nr:MFS transporter [Pseudomonadota bacterium]
MNRGPLKLKKNIFFLGVVSLLTDVSSEMIYPLLPLFLASVLGVSLPFIGLIEGVAESTASFMKVVSGWLSDRSRRRKPFIWIGYGLSTVVKPLFALSTAGWQVLLFRFGDRFGKGIRTSPRDAMIADSAPEKEKGKSFGFHRAMDSLGAVFGPLAAFLLLPVVGGNLRWIFFLAFIPAVLAVLVILFFVREVERDTPESAKTETVSIGWRDLGPEFRYFVVIVCLFTLGNSSDAFLVLRARDLGLSTVTIPLLWLFFNGVNTVFSIPGGMLSDRVGRKRVIFWSFLFYGLVYLGFAVAARPLHVWLLFALYGVYYGFSEGVLRAYVADLVPSRVRGTAYGVFHTATGTMAFPASLVMGILWHKFGAPWAFVFGAVLALISALLLLRIPHDKEIEPSLVESRSSSVRPIDS